MPAPGRGLKQWDQNNDTQPEFRDFQEDLPTAEIDAARLPSVVTGAAYTRLTDMARQLRQDIERNAPPAETPKDGIRRRLGTLLERAQQFDREGDSERAVLALELAFAESPDSALAHKLLSLHERTIERLFENFLGDLDAVPRLAINTDQLAYEHIDAHAAFLLSRMDHPLSFSELLDVAGMSRVHALRYSAILLLRGILIVSPL
jgi:hypothetical protein